jgi:hypothetical protein
MPGDTIRRYKTVSGALAQAVANSEAIVLADFTSSQAGVYATGSIQVPANTAGTGVWYAKTTPSSSYALLCDTTGAALATVAIPSGGGVIPIPVEAFGNYAVAIQCGAGTATTFVAGLMS